MPNSRSDAVKTAISTLKEAPGSTLTLADLVDLPIAIDADLAGDVTGPAPRSRPLAYNKQRNSTWRILEEQRMHSIEVAQECDSAIKMLEAKRDDALRAASACEMAQKTLASRA
jgi:hypothetical protein